MLSLIEITAFRLESKSCKGYFFLQIFRELPVERMKGGKRGRCTRSRTPPVRMPHNRKNSQKAVNNKSNARAKQLFSMPVSPLTKENGQSNRGNSNKHPFLQNCLTTNPKTLKLEFNPDDDNEESSDIKEEDSGDENNPADPSVI